MKRWREILLGLGLGLAIASCSARTTVGWGLRAGDSSTDTGPDADRTDAKLADGDLASSSVGPLGVCGTSATAVCGSGGQCVTGCPSSDSTTGLCSVPGRESCGCGATDQPCTTPGLDCLYPSCCDHQGLCVTAAERAAICAGAFSLRFNCDDGVAATIDTQRK